MNTICAISTASGGALGIVRISGPDAHRFVQAVFSRDISQATGYSLQYGSIVDPDSHDIIDEVLLSVFHAPRSYTGEDSIEISCHGSPYILQKVIQLLIAQGCSLAEPGEFTKRAFMNGKLDLSQAEAVADLIASQNSSQHRIAMQHLRGGISERLHQLRDQLLHLTSLLELELDFSDHEELEFADRQQLFDIANQIETEISRLSSSFSQGNAIKNGIPVAIIGAPNVGKSTLLNALLQDERAIVSPIQGTTRDIIEDTIHVDGILFRFIDTAGIRNTQDTIERMGIERSYKAAEKAQVIILVSEPHIPFVDVHPQKDQIVIRVSNKADKYTEHENNTISISALTGQGIDILKHHLISSVTDMGTQDEVLITNLRHKESLDIAQQDIKRAIEAMSKDIPSDLVAEDLRLCILHLASILGEDITPQEVLSNIFSHFCIGK